MPEVTVGLAPPMTAVTERTEHGPWNPGIQSQLPAAFLPLATVYRADNVFTGSRRPASAARSPGSSPRTTWPFGPSGWSCMSC